MDRNHDEVCSRAEIQILECLRLLGNGECSVWERCQDVFQVVWTVIVLHLLIQPGSYIAADSLCGLEAGPDRAAVKQSYLESVLAWRSSRYRRLWFWLFDSRRWFLFYLCFGSLRYLRYLRRWLLALGFPFQVLFRRLRLRCRLLRRRRLICRLLRGGFIHLRARLECLLGRNLGSAWVLT